MFFSACGYGRPRPPGRFTGLVKGKAMRVLLVDDDPMIGDAIHNALKDEAYAADGVTNRQTALTTLA